MNLLFLMVFSFFAFTTASARAQTVPTADLQHSRQELLDLLATEQQKAQQRPVLVNGEGANEANVLLAEFYRTQYFPQNQRLRKLSLEYQVYHLLVSRALYTNEAEQQDWMKKTEAAGNSFDELQSSDEYKAMIKKFGELAKNLDGELATLAQKEARDLALVSYNKKELALSQKITELSLKIDAGMNALPIANNLPQITQQINRINQKFHAGELDFTTAWQQKEPLIRDGFYGFSNQVAITFREQLNQLAILRTQLAQSKGFQTWARYVLAMGADDYAVGLKTVQEKKQLLKKMLAQLYRPLAHTLKEYYKQMTGDRWENFRLSQISLVLPPAEVKIREYFPRDRLVQIWRETMLQSGFAAADIDRVILDVYPRDGKEKGAYMSPITTTVPKEWVLDVASLQLVLEETPEAYVRAQTAIVQNFNDDGLTPLSIMFHEGGHHLHFTRELPTLLKYHAYGFVETHSMFMELFLADREFLLANGETAEGVKISAAQVDLYLQNKGLQELVSAHGNMLSALYDIEIWDRPYTEQSLGFVETCLATSQKLAHEFDPLPKKLPAGINPYADHFGSSHFISGNVRYIGYVFADFASLKVQSRVLDLLTEQTGRRSLYRQPSLASLLIEGLYQRGAAVPFPANIERFTGTNYDPADYVRLLLAPLKAGKGTATTPKTQVLPNAAQCDGALQKVVK